MKCPFCSEEIQNTAIKCRFCGEILDTIGFYQIRKGLDHDGKAPRQPKPLLLLWALSLTAVVALVTCAAFYVRWGTVDHEAGLAKSQEKPVRTLPNQPAPSSPEAKESSARQGEKDLSDRVFTPLTSIPSSNPIATSNSLQRLQESNGLTNKGPLPKPRTVQEALLRKHLAQPPGEKMKQEGGVRRRLELTSFDAKATPFGAYDAGMVEAIRQRWFSLLDESSYRSEARGKVVLKYRLHSDGKITDLEVAENSANEELSLICQKAVMDPAPYAAWSAEMRGRLGEVRGLQFTFYYQ